MKYISDYINLANSIKDTKKLNKDAEDAAEESHNLFKKRKDVVIISKRQAKNNDCTKDGRCWFVDLAYKDLLGKRHRYHSKKFATRREAKNHEAEYKMKIKNQNEFTDLTFKDLIQEHYQYQQDKVTVTTLSN